MIQSACYVIAVYIYSLLLSSVTHNILCINVTVNVPCAFTCMNDGSRHMGTPVVTGPADNVAEKVAFSESLQPVSHTQFTSHASHVKSHIQRPISVLLTIGNDKEAPGTVFQSIVYTLLTMNIGVGTMVVVPVDDDDDESVVFCVFTVHEHCEKERKNRKEEREGSMRKRAKRT